MESRQNGVEAAIPEELPCMSYSFRISELGKIAFELGRSNVAFQTAICRANRKADILTTRLKKTFRISTTIYS